MNLPSMNYGAGERKRKSESDDELVITNKRLFKKRMKNRPPEVDPSELCNLVGESSLEMPDPGDFGANGLDPNRFAWAPDADIAAIQISRRDGTPRVPRKAAPPSIPDPSDADWNASDRMSSSSRLRPQKRPPKSSFFVLPGDDDIQLENDTRLTQVVEDEGIRIFPIPLEIREEIYRYLLRSNMPIAVFDGWKRVYKHGNTRQTGPAFTDRPSLDISVLRLNKSFYPEAARILYSENIFLYRLRDPPAICPPPINLDALVAFDSPSSTTGSLEGDDPNDGDYQEHNPQSSTRRARSRRKKKELDEPYINVGKFHHLFRHVIIEAEHNRCGDDTLRSMQEALEILSNPPSVDKDLVPLYPSTTASELSKKKQKSERKAKHGVGREEARTPTIITPNIMTLVIKIRPSRLQNDSFTFVNFFDKKSPILEAIRNLQPQQLYVKVMMGQFTNRRNGVNISINFRHRRIIYLAESGEPDMWARDREMIIRRKRKAVESLKKLDELGSDVRKSCNRYLIQHSDIVEVDDEFDFEWDEIEDDEFEFAEQTFMEGEFEDEPQAEETQEEVPLEVQDESAPVIGSGWIEEVETQGEAVSETQAQEEVPLEVQDESVPVPGSGWIEEIEAHGGVVTEAQVGEAQEELQPEVQDEPMPVPGSDWIEEVETQGEVISETRAEEAQEELQPEVQFEPVPVPGSGWIEETEAQGREVTEAQSEESEEE
ncbi:unnamed protein product [Clonostachys rhizophaga]|uniref:Uncharacterized protein n=1 Tax=Clonostachys rhizophaga TaxID=160324 RepID=A0A9N9YHS7_9HYPO|nr:unnamed protein product [Clonostachys rhizophaga]